MSKQIADDLIEHVNNVIDNLGNGKIKKALFSEEPIDPSIRGDCTRIFSTSGETFKSSITKAKPELELLSASLLQDLRDIQLTISEETIKKIDLIVNTQLKVLKENPSWDSLLSKIKDEGKRNDFARDAETSLMFKLVTDLYVTKKSIDQDTAKFVSLITNTRSENMESRIKKLSDKFPQMTRVENLSVEPEIPQTRPRR